MTLRKLIMLVMLILQADGKPSSSCSCGLRQQRDGGQISLKITGGEEAAPNEFPWAAFMEVRAGGKVSNCGGSLINDRYVLTAAHCVSNSGPLEIYVVLGEHKQSKDDSQELVIRADAFLIHHQYDAKKKLYDIALVRLAERVNFESYPHIRPICLPDGNFKDYRDEEAVVVAGWGLTNIEYAVGLGRSGNVLFWGNDSSPADTLQKLDMRIVRQKTCYEILRDLRSDFPNLTIDIGGNNLCAASLVGDSCRGDSGGSLMMRNRENGYYEIIGVVSHGLGCNSVYKGESVPGVYARVSSVVSWIQRKAVDGVFCNKSYNL